jgi:hypothetical protein
VRGKPRGGAAKVRRKRALAHSPKKESEKGKKKFSLVRCGKNVEARALLYYCLSKSFHNHFSNTLFFFGSTRARLPARAGRSQCPQPGGAAISGRWRHTAVRLAKWTPSDSFATMSME